MSAVVIRGDARALPLPDASVDLIVTSPPFFGLRDYRDAGESMAGQVGSEATPGEYIAALLDCTRDWMRVLKPPGSLFVELGDKYDSGTTTARVNPGTVKDGQGQGWNQGTPRVSLGRPKCLLDLPHRYAIRCVDDLGLIKRAEIIWHHVNGLPECLDPSTPVFIRQDGWVSRVPIDALTEMRLLPEILGPNGWVQVRKVWETVKSAIYFHASKVERITCSPDHRFPVSSERRSTRTRNVPADEIRHQGYADYLLYCPVSRFLAEPALTHFAGWPLDATTGYLLGVYAAEGGVQGMHGTGVKLTIGSHETDFADRIRIALKACGVTAREYPAGNALSFEFHSDRFARLAAGFVSGNVKRKALNIEFLLNAPESFRRAVLDGYVDGDGSPRPGGGWIAVSASIQLRDDVSTLASSVGIITSKGSRTENDPRTGGTYTAHTIWTPYITRRKAKTGMDGVYQVPPRAKREAKGEPRRMIDIEVDGTLFLIGDGLITHNSVQDRVRRAHSVVFHFTLQPRYYAAVDEVREAHQPQSVARTRRRYDAGDLFSVGTPNTLDPAQFCNPLGKLPGSVWDIPSQPLTVPGWLGVDHFAAFPMELPRRIISGWSPPGICTACGEGRRPVVAGGRSGDGSKPHKAAVRVASFDWAAWKEGEPHRITGYACACSKGVMPDGTVARQYDPGSARHVSGPPPGGLPPTRPAVVLDPFGGTGTTALVASMLGRHGISIDRSADYCRLARWRVNDSGERARALGVPKPPPVPDGQGALFDSLEAS